MATYLTSNIFSDINISGNCTIQGTMSSGNPFTFKNALYNGDFRIAQRGTSFTNPSVVYTLDRWYISTYGAVGNGTVSQIQSGLANFSNAFQLATTSTTNGNWYISQSLETRDVVRFQGQPVTVSFWYKIPTSFTSAWSPTLFWTTSVDTAITNAVSGSPNTAGSGNMPNTTAWTYTQFQAFVPSTAQALSVMFTTYNNTVNGATLQITGVQLEKGSVATPYEILPYATELALCQRYYYRLTAGSSNQNISTGIGVSSSNIHRFQITTPVLMRTSNPMTIFTPSGSASFPSSSLSLTSSELYIYNGGPPYVVAVLSASDWSSTNTQIISFQAQTQAASTATPGLGQLFFLNYSGSYLALSAEL